MRLLYTVMLLLFVASVQGQSAFAITDKGKATMTPQQISLKNPWVGASFSYNLAGEGTEDNFLFSAKAMYFLIQEAKWGLPALGAISPGSSDILAAGSGYNFGLYPYYLLKSGEKFDLIAHGGAAYKVIPGKDSIETVNQFRFLAGLELTYWGDGRSKSATTISLTPVFTLNDSIDDVSFFEGTVIIPIGGYLGLLGEIQVPFNGNDVVYRAGVIIRTQL